MGSDEFGNATVYRTLVTGNQRQLDSRLQLSSIPSPLQRIYVGGSIVIMLLAQLVLIFKLSFYNPFRHARTALILAGIVLTGISLFVSNEIHSWLGLLILFIVVLQEIIGKWSFYQAGHKAYMQAGNRQKRRGDNHSN